MLVIGLHSDFDSHEIKSTVAELMTESIGQLVSVKDIESITPVNLTRTLTNGESIYQKIEFDTDIFYLGQFSWIESGVVSWATGGRIYEARVYYKGGEMQFPLSASREYSCLFNYFYVNQITSGVTTLWFKGIKIKMSSPFLPNVGGISASYTIDPETLASS